MKDQLKGIDLDENPEGEQEFQSFQTNKRIMYQLNERKPKSQKASIFNLRPQEWS